ncbi:MAG TPA: DUF1153 domain-containing protein [Alphaproteobacteria bacterium]|nr:DUF1153 domain-containing protein [Alphaproteobacteria bacterium]
MARDATRDPFNEQAHRRIPAHSGTDTGGGSAAFALAADLPRPDARRWYRRDKRKVIAAVRRGALSFREACRHYRLSYQEFVDWERISGADEPVGRIRQDNERRRYHRIALRSPASLRFAGRRVECEIENLSATGALLMVGESRGLPAQVTLEVPHSRDALPARIAWRGRNALGVEFAAAPGQVASKFSDRWVEGSNALRRNAR